MRNFQDNFERRGRSFISAFSVCMTVILMQTVLPKTSDVEVHSRRRPEIFMSTEMGPL